MKVRKFKTNIEQLKEAGLSFVQQNGETKMIYRATIVNMYLKGTSTKVLSEACGESPATIPNLIKQGQASNQGYKRLATCTIFSN